MTFEELLDQAIDLLRRRGRVTYRALKLHFHLDDDTLDVLKDELLYGQPRAVEAEGQGLVWTGAPAAVPDTRPPAEAERQLHTMVLAVMALLQREKRVTYRALCYVFGVDEACLHAVRDELRFRQLAREEDGQGLVWTGEDAPPVVSASHPAPAPAVALSVVSPRPPLPPLEAPQPLPEPLPALDGVSSLPVDDVVSHPPADVPVLTPALAQRAGGGTTAAHGAVLRPGGLHAAVGPARPGRLACGGARLPGGRGRGHPALRRSYRPIPRRWAAGLFWLPCGP